MWLVKGHVADQRSCDWSKVMWQNLLPIYVTYHTKLLVEETIESTVVSKMVQNKLYGGKITIRILSSLPLDYTIHHMITYWA